MMRNKIFKLSIVIVAVVFLAGCDLAWQRYSNRAYGFSILLPRGWERMEGFRGTVITIRAPRKNLQGKFQANINVVAGELEKDLDLSTYFELNRDQTLKLVPNIEGRVSEGEIYASRLEGKWFSFISIAGGVNIKIISAVWKKGKRVYVVSCSCDALKYPQYEQTFSKVMRSLRIYKK